MEPENTIIKFRERYQAGLALPMILRSRMACTLNILNLTSHFYLVSGG